MDEYLFFQSHKGALGDKNDLIVETKQAKGEQDKFK